MTRFNFGGWDL